MRKYGATVLHDFFVDRLVFSGNLKRLLSSVGTKGDEGGGGIHGVPQKEIRGGNAVNLAEELSRLGTKTYLVTHSDKAHLKLLKETFSRLDTTLSVKRLEPGLTVAFEAKNRSRVFNVMLGHVGGAGEFSPALLTEQDWRAMEDSELVCSVNWAANRHGTELLKAIRARIPKTRLFLDPADVRDRIDEYRTLINTVKREGLIDWLSVNEFEGVSTARLLGVVGKDPARMCKRMASELSAKVDLHTERASFTSDGKDVESHKTKVVIPSMMTGAGDVWDAASVHFYLKGEDDRRRIELADLAAGFYVRSADAVGPTEKETLSLLQHS